MLKGVTCTLCDRRTPFLIELDRTLRKELENVLHNENLLWVQKSRVSFLLDGERNTRFFHLSTIVRRKTNFATSLKDSNGDWVSDTEQLKGMALDQFSALFSEDGELALALDNGSLSFPILTDAHRRRLEWKTSGSEVWDAVKKMGCIKFPARTVSR